MTNTQYFGSLIFTNHALKRMEERKMVKQMAIDAFNNPDHTKTGKQAGTTEYIKKIADKTVTVIAKQNEKQQWVVLSAWTDPPYPGTKDHKNQQYYHTYRKAGFWGKIWLTLKNQLGF